MFKIFDNRDNFYQWDINQKLVVKDSSIREVHFCNRTEDCALVCEVYEYEGVLVADVPNILLQEDWRIRVYAYTGDYTKYEACFNVSRRSKPADYVYTETEVKRYETLEVEIEALKEAIKKVEDETDVIIHEDVVYNETIKIGTSKIKMFESAPFVLVAGDTYKVNWNNEVYECIARSSVYDNTDGSTNLIVYQLGNGAIEGAFIPSVDTGEPFLFEWFDNQEEFYGYLKCSVKETDITLTITHIEKEYKKIPVETLPDGVPYLVNGVAAVLEETSVVGNLDNPAMLPDIKFIVGETYKVVIDGVEYSTEAVEIQTDDESGIVLGNTGYVGMEDNGLPFVIMKVMGMTLFVMVEDDSEHTLAIYSTIQKNKLLEELLPDTVATKAYVEELLGGIENGYY